MGNFEFDVVVLTDSRYVNPEPGTVYIRNILTEDRLVCEALKARGLKVARKDWADPDFDWKRTRSALFRTTWDYFDRFDSFSKWLNKVSGVTKLINSPEIIRWNMDKHYLDDLKEAGIPVLPTRYIEKGEEITLAGLMEETGWDETVIKPTVGGAGRYTYRLNRDNLGEHEKEMKRLFKEEDFMLQPYQKRITETGEWSYMIIGDHFSHAVLKKAKPGDFRVQDDFGGTVHHYNPSPEEILFALDAVKACSPQPVYARVDVVRDNQDELAVTELELIEPELWFRKKPESAAWLADEVLSCLNSG